MCVCLSVCGGTRERQRERETERICFNQDLVQIKCSSSKILYFTDEFSETDFKKDLAIMDLMSLLSRQNSMHGINKVTNLLTYETTVPISMKFVRKGKIASYNVPCN